MYFDGPLRALPLSGEQIKPFVVRLRAQHCVFWVT